MSKRPLGLSGADQILINLTNHDFRTDVVQSIIKRHQFVAAKSLSEEQIEAQARRAELAEADAEVRKRARQRKRLKLAGKQ